MGTGKEVKKLGTDIIYAVSYLAIFLKDSSWWDMGETIMNWLLPIQSSLASRQTVAEAGRDHRAIMTLAPRLPTFLIADHGR